MSCEALGRSSVILLMVGGLCSCHNPPDLAGFEAVHGWNPARLEDQARVSWRAEVGRGHAALVASDGRIYTMGHRRLTEDGELVPSDVVTCLDAATGNELWTYAYPCDDIYFPGPRATPAVVDGRVYTLSWDGQVHCLDAGDGALLWRRHLVEDGLGEVPHWGLAGSPLVVGEMVVVTAGASGAALDRLTGATVWRSEAAETSLPTPVAVNGGTVVAVAGGEQLQGVDVGTGRVVWSVPWDKEVFVSPTPVGTALLLPGTRRTRLVDVSGEEPRVVHDIPARFSEYQGYAVVEGHVYGFRGPHLQCVEIATGKIRWRHKVGAHGSLTAHRGALVILEGDGHLTVAEATPDGYRELARTGVFDLPSNRGVPQPEQHHCWTAPTVAEGRVLVRSNDGAVAALELG